MKLHFKIGYVGKFSWIVCPSSHFISANISLDQNDTRHVWIGILCPSRYFKKQTIQFFKEHRQQILCDPCKARILPFCERNRRLLPNYKGTKTVVCGRHQTSFPFFSSSFSLSHSRRDTTLSSDRKETFIVSPYFKLFV